MHLTIDEVRRIAALAKLELSSEEEELFVAQLGKIVDYFDQLRSYETRPPGDFEIPPVEAADVALPGLDREVFLAGAPQTLDGFLVVPQVKVTRREEAP